MLSDTKLFWGISIVCGLIFGFKVGLIVGIGLLVMAIIIDQSNKLSTLLTGLCTDIMEDYNLWYLLDDNNNPYPATIEEWSKGFKSKKIVKQEEIGNVFVSTVFLGLDYRMTANESDLPILFETMVFDPNDNNDHLQQRYATYNEALIGHQQMVNNIKQNN